jgi:hypothetical protein
MLPLPQNDLLEVLVALARKDDEELAASAQNTLPDRIKRELADLG